jgi:uncharacterized protein (TIRG00374 family)
MVFAVNWTQVWQELLLSNYLMLIPASIVVIFHYILRALRWRALLPEATHPGKFSDLFDGIMVGNFASYFLPLRAGEFIRPFVLTRASSYSFSSAFATVVIERFFDLTAVLLSFVYVVNSVPEMPALVHQGVYALSVLAAGLCAFIIVGVFFPRFAEWAIDFGLAIVPSKIRAALRKFLLEFVQGTSVLRNPRRFITVVALSALVWLSCYLFFVTFMLVVRVPYSDFGSYFLIASCVAVVVALAVAAPSSPGFVGVYQVGCTLGFALFGVAESTAIAFAILSHIFQYILFSTYGFYFLSKAELRFQDLKQVAQTRGQSSTLENAHNQ